MITLLTQNLVRFHVFRTAEMPDKADQAMAVDAADAAVHRIQDHFVFLREQTQGTAGLLRPEQSTDPLEHLADKDRLRHI